MVNAQDAVWVDVLPSMRGFGPALEKGTGSEADKVGKATGGRFGKAMLAGVAVVGAGAALATKALIDVGKTFDNVSDTIRTGTGATGQALADLETAAKNVGRNVPASFEDIGTAIADVNTRLGLTGPELEARSEQFLELSRITGTDLATNIENVSRVFGDWGVAAEDQAGSMDYLFKVAQSTGIGLDELSGKVVQYGAPMRQFGFSFEESAALMGKWAKEGVNTETIMGGLRAGLGKLAKAGEDPAEAFKEVTDQIKNAGSEGEATAIAIETFGQRAGPDLAAAVREGRFELDDLMSTLEASDETIMAAGEDTMDFAEQWLMFKNEVLVLVEPLAKRMFDALGTGIAWLKDTGIPAVKDFSTWLNENKTVLLTMTGVVGALVAGLVVYHATVGIVRAATAAWVTVQGILNGTLLLNPIGLVVVALVALVAAIVIAYQNSETFRKIVQGAWKGIQDAVSYAWEKVIKPAFQALTSFITDTLAPAAMRLWKDTIKPAFEGIWGAIKTAWGFIQPILQLWVDILLLVVAPAISKLWNETVKPVFDSIGGHISRVWKNDVKPILEAFGNFIRDTVAPAFQKGVEDIGTAWDKIKEIARKPVNFVIDTVYNNGIRSVFNKVADAVGSKATLPRVDVVARAKGGWTRPGWTLVGEEGPELVDFATPGRVYTANQTQAMTDAPGMAGPSIGDLASGAKDLVGGGLDWVLGGLRKLAERALGGLVDRIDAGGVLGDILKGVAQKSIDSVLGFAGDRDKEAQSAGGPVTANGSGGLGPAAKRAHQAVRDVFGFGGTIGGYSYRNIAGTNKLSKHALGKAIDVMTYSNTALGQQIANYFVGSRVKYGVDNVIFNRRIHSGSGWGPYRGENPHTDHPHIDFYDQGGWLSPGISQVRNDTGKPEAILNPQQWQDISVLAARGAEASSPLPDHMTLLLEDGTELRGYVQRTAAEGSRHNRRMRQGS